MNEQLSNWFRRYQSYSYASGKTWGEYFYDPEVEGVNSVCYGDIKENQDGEYIEVPYCTYSDYSGTTVERSNCQTFLDMFKEFNEISMWKMYGGWGTTGVLIRKSLYENNDEVKEVIDGLFDYPVISEDDLSQLEIELEHVSWDSYLKDELIRGLESNDIEYNEETLQEDFYFVADDIAEYFIHEDACCPYFRTEKVIDAWVETLAKREENKNEN